MQRARRPVRRLHLPMEQPFVVFALHPDGGVRLARLKAHSLPQEGRHRAGLVATDDNRV